MLNKNSCTGLDLSRLPTTQPTKATPTHLRGATPYPNTSSNSSSTRPTEILTTQEWGTDRGTRYRLSAGNNKKLWMLRSISNSGCKAETFPRKPEFYRLNYNTYLIKSHELQFSGQPILIPVNHSLFLVHGTLFPVNLLLFHGQPILICFILGL